MSSIENKLVSVVIPVYKSTLTDLEVIAYKQCMKVLSSRYTIIIVHPEGLQLPSLLQSNNHVKITFEAVYFQNIDGYNNLLISKQFYQRFSDYTYILIYQLDAFVFQDTLTEWCQKGYDYIGAPSLPGDAYRQLTSNESAQLKAGMQQLRPVLNGGLSLRKVGAMLRYLTIYNAIYPAWKGNEDKLFSLDAQRLKPMKWFIKLPDWMTAMQFAFEKSPEACFELTNRQLPFGCHAWEKYDRDFWKPFIEEV